MPRRSKKKKMTILKYLVAIVALCITAPGVLASGPEGEVDEERADIGIDIDGAITPAAENDDHFAAGQKDNGGENEVFGNDASRDYIIGKPNDKEKHFRIKEQDNGDRKEVLPHVEGTCMRFIYIHII